MVNLPFPMGVDVSLLNRLLRRVDAGREQPEACTVLLSIPDGRRVLLRSPAPGLQPNSLWEAADEGIFCVEVMPAVDLGERIAA
ncbi:hypothetical protein [Tuwongella immobilis]|uniref:Uncharacterized protein n=1 Tax=Tuwongella immobilis TaxID=692036 RepID=A0A6C2YPM0_9BACT|nr:hypothetical protein [Tuwongella immobilis]VIP02975.1 unnamed protein product [Tuwongella immobilis]VTS03013.1 unnamed protein product [Tuwongella immobilis]